MQWLCDCYLPSLWRFVYTRVNGDRHLAEDITNETILAMLTTIQLPAASAMPLNQSQSQSQAKNQWDAEILNLAGWLRTVAGRRITDHFRAAARVQHLLQQSPNIRSDTDVADPSKQHELKETRVEVRKAMDSMPDQFRLALEWKYLDKLSVREIAERWGMTEKAAESILFRARREFRERLAKPQEKSTEPSRNGKRSRPLDSTADEAAKKDPAHKSM
jgi:RNA polymerase sigma factor (sigma-70 family)